MEKRVKHKKCNLCRYMHFEQGKEERYMLCNKPNGCAQYPKCFAAEDWRDNVWLEHGEGMIPEERRKRAEVENPHIVAVQAEIKRERIYSNIKKRIAAHIQRTGGIDGYTLIRRSK